MDICLSKQSAILHIHSLTICQLLCLGGLLNLFGDLLHGALSFARNGLDGLNGLLLNNLCCLGGGAFLATLPHQDTGNLNSSDTSKEEVDGGKPKVVVCQRGTAAWS